MSDSIIFAFDPLNKDYMLREQAQELAKDYGSQFITIRENITGKSIDECFKMAEKVGCFDVGFILSDNLIQKFENTLPQLYENFDIAFIPSVSFMPPALNRLREDTLKKTYPKIMKLPKNEAYLNVYLLYYAAFKAKSVEAVNDWNALLNNISKGGKLDSSITNFMTLLSSNGGQTPKEADAYWGALAAQLDKNLMDGIKNNSAKLYEENKENIKHWVETINPAYSGKMNINASNEVVVVLLPFNLPVKGALEGYKDIATIRNLKGNIFIPTEPYNNWPACANQGNGAFLPPNFLIEQSAAVFGIIDADKAMTLNIQNANYLYEFIQNNQRANPGVKLVFYICDYVRKFILPSNISSYLDGESKKPNAYIKVVNKYPGYESLKLNSWNFAQQSKNAAIIMGQIADRIMNKKLEGNIFQKQVDKWQKTLDEQKKTTDINKEVVDNTTQEAKDKEEAKKKKEDEGNKKDFIFDINKHGWIAAMVAICIGEKSGQIPMGDKEGGANALDILKAFINPEDIKAADSLKNSLGLGILDDVARVAKAIAKEAEKAEKSMSDYNKMSEQQKQLMLIGGDPEFPKLIPLFDPIASAGIKK